MDATLNGLLHSRKFYLAVFGLVQTLVFTYVPGFPREVWQAIDALVVVLIAGIAVEDLGSKAGGGSRDPGDGGG